jgi:hypothetical protein
MPTRPYRILSRNLYQRLGARAAWDRAIEIIRKSERGRGAAQALMRTLRNARDEHLAEIKADLGRYQDLGDVEMIPELDTRIESMTKEADTQIADSKKGRRRTSISPSVPRRDIRTNPGRSSRARK